MEVDLSELKKGSMLYVTLALASLVALMFLGRAFTPPGNRLLTWQEWQIRKLQRVYHAERLELLNKIDTLAELLNAPPDPVRAQVLVQDMQRDLANGIEALAVERQYIADAAQAVLDWESGVGDYNAAVMAVENALKVLDAGHDER